MIEIDAVNQHRRSVELEPLKQAAEKILADHHVTSGALSIAVVDDESIHRLNREHLQHDYPTDVLSFLLERDGERLEGDIVVSLDTAEREAGDWGWSTEDELLLYVVHGALHLVGFDDHSEADRLAMRRREVAYFAELGRPEPPGRLDTHEQQGGGVGD